MKCSSLTSPSILIRLLWPFLLFKWTSSAAFSLCFCLSLRFLHQRILLFRQMNYASIFLNLDSLKKCLTNQKLFLHLLNLIDFPKTQNQTLNLFFSVAILNTLDQYFKSFSCKCTSMLTMSWTIQWICTTPTKIQQK